MSQDYRLARASEMDWAPTRRAGIRQKALFGPDQPTHQNLILVDYDPDADVELHAIGVPESIFVVSGSVRIIGPEGEDDLVAEDAVYFDPGSSHGLKAGPEGARCLVVFSPAGLS